jgi:hypothetical protein
MSEQPYADNPLLVQPAGDPPAPRVPSRVEQVVQVQPASAPAPQPTLSVAAGQPMDGEPTSPGVVDALAEEAAKITWPEDAPTLWPYLKLPFRERANFFREYKALQSQQGLVRELKAITEQAKASGTEPDASVAVDKAAEIFELYAVMDTLMMICAVDKEAYAAWVASHTDDEFSRLFTAFMSKTQPGEASSSAG